MTDEARKTAVPAIPLMPPGTGDLVEYDGERGVVAFYRDGYLYPCGWPLCRVPWGSVRLVERATPHERQILLEQMAAMSTESDPRCRYAREVLRVTQ